MGEGLVINEPTTLLRDWLRATFDPQIWAGGWPQGADLPGTIMYPITVTLNGPVKTWAYQFDSFAAGAPDGGGQPSATGLSGRLATHLLRTPPRTVLGTNEEGTVLFHGAVESTMSIAPKPPDSADPGVYGSTLLIDITTTSLHHVLVPED